MIKLVCPHNKMQVVNYYLRERSSITSARLGGGGGSGQNADAADALDGGVGAKMMTC